MRCEPQGEVRFRGRGDCGAQGGDGCSGGGASRRVGWRDARDKRPVRCIRGAASEPVETHDVARAGVETQVAALSSKQADPGRALDAPLAMLRAELANAAAAHAAESAWLVDECAATANRSAVDAERASDGVHARACAPVWA